MPNAFIWSYFVNRHVVFKIQQ